MKRLIALLTSLVCAMLFAAAMAENAQAISPLLQLYQAEQALLFDTMNVTMTGHAVFTADGRIFKTADLFHIQDSINSMRDWRLLTPTPTGDERETGYTVVTKEEHVEAFESYHHGHKWYSVEPSRQRWSILRHTVASDTLTNLAGLLMAQCGNIGESTANDDGTTSISIHLTKDDVPAIMDPLLNSVLQYGINRYTGWYNYASDSTVTDASYDCYNTISEGLMVCLRAVHLRELSVDAVLDEQDRVLRVSGTMVLDYEDKMRTSDSELRLDFEQTAINYGTSHVNDDPASYNHWGAAEAPAVPDEYVPLYDRIMENEATQLLLHGLYWNPKGGTHLHADPNCPSVSSTYLPLDKANLTPELLLEYSLCSFCVDASPFLNDEGNASLDVAAGDLVAALTYDKSHGLNELFWDFDAKFGLFRTWSYAQKHYFTAMLPTLSQREIERIEQYHPEWLPDTRLCEMLCVWSYGLPQEGADTSAKDAATEYVLAKGLLTQDQQDMLSVTCNYYTGSSFVLPFAKPWWVIRYSDKTTPVCEVWLDSTMTEIHAVDIQRMTNIAQKALMEHDPHLGNEPVSLDTIKDFSYYVLKLRTPKAC